MYAHMHARTHAHTHTALKGSHHLPLQVDSGAAKILSSDTRGMSSLKGTAIDDDGLTQCIHTQLEFPCKVVERRQLILTVLSIQVALIKPSLTTHKHATSIAAVLCSHSSVNNMGGGMLLHSSLNGTLNYRHGILSWRNGLLLYTTYQSCQKLCQVWRGHGALIQENVLCSMTNVRV